jgi:hypothetical protein
MTGEHAINISYAPEISASPSSFEIKFADYQSLDFTIWIREHIQAYDVTTSPPRRIAPLGLMPEDFLDEWVSSPWPLAGS